MTTIVINSMGRDQRAAGADVSLRMGPRHRCRGRHETNRQDLRQTVRGRRRRRRGTPGERPVCRGSDPTSASFRSITMQYYCNSNIALFMRDFGACSPSIGVAVAGRNPHTWPQKSSIFADCDRYLLAVDVGGSYKKIYTLRRSVVTYSQLRKVGSIIPESDPTYWRAIIAQVIFQNWVVSCSTEIPNCVVEPGFEQRVYHGFHRYFIAVGSDAFDLIEATKRIRCANVDRDRDRLLISHRRNRRRPLLSSPSGSTS